MVTVLSRAVKKSGLLVQPACGGHATLMRAIGARLLMTFKAECFAVGRCIGAAVAYCCAVMRFPCSALALVVVLKYKSPPTTFTLAVSIVEDLALCFRRESHSAYFLKRVFHKTYHSGVCDSGQVLPRRLSLLRHQRACQW